MTDALASVLVVEDELIVATDLQHSLEDTGYDAFAVAASGDEAVACAEERWPDVVLMDIRIRGKQDGVHLAGLLKKRSPVIVIFLTAHADATTLDRAKQATPDGYLLKPVQPAELRCAIEVALHKRRVEDEAEKRRQAEARLFAIANNVPIAVAYFDTGRTLRFANRIFNERLAAHRTTIEAATFEALAVAQQLGHDRPVQGFLDLTDGTRSHRFEVTHLADRDEQGEVVGVYTIAYDVTARELLSADLDLARRDLETILNAVPARISAWHADLTNRFSNVAAEAWFGVEHGLASGRHLRDLIGDAQFNALLAPIEVAVSGLRTADDHVEDGEDGPRYWHDEYIPEAKGATVTVLYVVSFDMTEARRAQDRIRLLALRLESVREEERRAVAVRLHDGIAQDLFVLKLGVDKLHAELRNRGEADNLCADLQAAIVVCMEDTRQIADELRPTGLKLFGLVATLAQHVQKFASRANLASRFTAPETFPVLDDDRQLLFFRAAQEALTNVARHAKASAVTVELRVEPLRITLDIADNGSGFTDAALRKSRSLGLVALRERFEALDGGLSVSRRLPKGTVFSCYLSRPAAPPRSRR